MSQAHPPDDPYQTESDHTMTDQHTPRPAMTMHEIREALGRIKHGQPEVIVSITRYTVSVLPSTDINHKYWSLYVELKPGGWVLHNGHEFYTEEGGWEPSQSLARRFADYDEALVLAREAAPDLSINGRTAAEVWQRTYAAASAVSGAADSRPA